MCLEEPDHMAQCGQCEFVFCSMCQESWHPGTQCLNPELRLVMLEQRRQRSSGQHDPER